MPPSRKSRRARRRRRAAGTRNAPPPVDATSSTGAQPVPARWASLPAWSRHPATAAFALSAIIAVSFFPALSAGFVWDDGIFSESPAVRTWSGLWTIWFSPAEIEGEDHYWPIVYTTFWLEHKLWGLAPFGTHLVNVLLYMVSVLLLWQLLLRLEIPGAWAVAAVFAVHPMHVESVVWGIGRKDLLSGLFYVAAALFWIRSIGGLDGGRPRPPESIGVSRRGLYLAALGFFALAMLSKSAAITLPVAFAILLWWKNGRVTWTDAWRIGPFFLVAVVIALADLAYYTSGVRLDIDYGPFERVLIAARALWFYAGKLIWPTDLAVIYPLWEIDVGDALAWTYVVAALAVAALLWYGRHRLGRGPIAGAALFAVTLSPVLGFVDFGYMQLSLVAERYAYLAGVGFVTVLVGGAAYGASRLPDLPRVGVSAVLVAVLGVFGKLTWDQAQIYRDDITFYNHVLSLSPRALSAHHNLTKALIDAGRPAEALDVSRMAVERRPGAADGHVAEGAALFALGRLDEAEKSFRRALERDPDDMNTRHNMAETLRQQGRFAEAMTWYRRVLDIDPEYEPAHTGMGEALFHLGRYRQAVESLARAISLEPDVVPIKAFYLLAEGLRRQQRNEEAIEAYRDVLEIDPEYAPAHSGIGYALLGLERYEDALGSLARSVSLQPESPDAADRHAAMGRAYQQLGRSDEAATQYERALTIDPHNATALDSFAVLRFGQQRYEEALSLYETLIAVDEANAQAHANMGATLYELGRPDEALRSLDRALSMDPALARTGFGEMRDVLQRTTQ